jgi:hypothetical protein
MFTTDVYTTIEELLDAVISVRSVPRTSESIESRESLQAESIESCSSCVRGQFRNSDEGKCPPLRAATDESSEVRD